MDAKAAATDILTRVTAEGEQSDTEIFGLEKKFVLNVKQANL